MISFVFYTWCFALLFLSFYHRLDGSFSSNAEVRRLRFASSSLPVQHEQKALDTWKNTVPGQFDDADNN